MNILILGGTGAMGEHLVKILSQNPINEIYVTSRKKRVDFEKVHYLLGDAHDDVFLDFILNMHSWDVLIDFMVYKTEEFLNRANKILSKTGQYIFLSSCRVFADTSEIITESTPRLLDVSKDEKFLLSDDYPITKARQEDILLENRNRNWTIVRPYITFSSQRLQLGVYEKEYWLYRAINQKKVIFSKDISESITTLTFGRDVSYGISKLVGRNDSLGQDFNITTGENLLWKEALAVYQKVFYDVKNRDMLVDLVDSPNIDAIAISSVWPIKYDRLYNRKFDNSKFLQFVGSDFHFAPVKDTLGECLYDFLMSGGVFKDISYSTMAYFDRISSEKSNLRGVGFSSVLKYNIYRYTNLFEKRTQKNMLKKGQELF